MKRKNVKIIIPIALVAILVIAGVLTYRKVTPTSAVRIDTAIIEVTDKYIAGLVGQTEFDKNYKINYTASTDCGGESQTIGCYVAYDFLPAARYGASPFQSYYTGHDKSVAIATNNVPISLPSCERDKNKCDFKLSKTALDAIAKKEKVESKNLILVEYNGEIVGSMSYCNLETSEGRIKIYVSLQDGGVLWRGPNSECQGIA